MSPAAEAPAQFVLPVRVGSELTLPNVPMDPEIDFATLLANFGEPGRVDGNSIRVIDATTGRPVAHALSHDFHYGDRGQVRWVIADPSHREFEIRFRATATRRPLQPATYTPPIGTGDLLRYNAGEPRPLTMPYLSRLVDLTGDGRRDLVGCWMYAYEPGQPWNGIFCFPRTGGGDAEDSFEFGDPVRLRYVAERGSGEFKHFSSKYMHADINDLDGDGLADVVFSGSGIKDLRWYLNTGRRDDGGMPIFVAAGRAPRGTAKFGPCRAVDLDGDGAIDFVIGNVWRRNTNPQNWPPALAEPVNLDAGRDPCFLDLDGDGKLDAVSLGPGPGQETRAFRLVWRRNLGIVPREGETAAAPKFSPPEALGGIDPQWCKWLASQTDGQRPGLLVSHDVRQKISFFQLTKKDQRKPEFREFGQAVSRSAVLSMTDQPWPWFCDWDADGDLDLLVGGGFGWPRIALNHGTRQRPAYGVARRILAGGEPVRVLRDEILGGRHWHNMGYPLPVFIDWDGDGRSDLMLPNETNRIFWCRNTGSAKSPRFRAKEQLLVDGFPDSPEHRARSAALAGDRAVENSPYPYQEDRPFFWRVGAGFADFNGDGHMDLITHDGHTRKLTLFAQFADGAGNLRLRKAGPLKLSDGRLIDDTIVGRKSHWSESFRCIDWDGDRLIDVIYSCAGSSGAKGSIFLLRNAGTAREPVFEPPVTMKCFGKPIYLTEHGPHPWVGDYDGDGRPDIVACVEFGVYPFFSNSALSMSARPEVVFGELTRVTGE